MARRDMSAVVAAQPERAAFGTRRGVEVDAAERSVEACHRRGAVEADAAEADACEGTAEGTSEADVAEGTAEGIAEGTAAEGTAEGTAEADAAEADAAEGTAEGTLSLEVKPFGKAGVRLCWSCTPGLSGLRGSVLAELRSGPGWLLSSSCGRARPGSPCGRMPGCGACGAARWRLRSAPWAGWRGAPGPRGSPGARESRSSRLARRSSCTTFSSGTELEELTTAQASFLGGPRAFLGSALASLAPPPAPLLARSARQGGGPGPIHEICADLHTLYGYPLSVPLGTVVIDMRPGDEPRLTESLICPDAASLAGLPFRDDAVVVGDLPPASMDVLRGRVSRCVYKVRAEMVRALLAEFPLVGGQPSEKRAVLPNIVGARLAVGHQGHASILREWSDALGIVGVLNLAPNKVASDFSAIEDRARYIELFHDDGLPLTDTVGDGHRLSDVLPRILNSIESALQAYPSGRVFVHCQQGRSRAGSVAVAYMLVSSPGWRLFDAVSFVAARRPELEINASYAEVLEEFALSLGRQPSLPYAMTELPLHFRGGGVARDFRDKCFDASSHQGSVR
ncbi:unnamed protein product [Prorocentrum cordatum]|uniref:protein-tyrosine-phosphatase n=1 Tax=Prorocentrum cordatum TaxID=2364126 RepID=A0ABN9W7W8_9DINO|nr:unnamed protein product [Polarella glacialis]